MMEDERGEARVILYVLFLCTVSLFFFFFFGTIYVQQQQQGYGPESPKAPEMDPRLVERRRNIQLTWNLESALR